MSATGSAESVTDLESATNRASNLFGACFRTSAATQKSRILVMIRGRVVHNYQNFHQGFFAGKPTSAGDLAPFLINRDCFIISRRISGGAPGAGIRSFSGSLSHCPQAGQTTLIDMPDGKSASSSLPGS
jgi:hypothetical protein